MSPNVELAAIATVLALIWQYGHSAWSPTLRALIMCQVIYWSLAYVVRPWVVLAGQRAPRTNDDLADPRLHVGPGLVENAQSVLRVILLGLVLYYVALVLVRPGKALGVRISQPFMYSMLPAVVLYATAWIARGYTYLYGGENPLFSSLAEGGGIAVGLLIIRVWYRTTATFRWTVAVCYLLECAWGALIASKTPALGALLFVIVAAYNGRFGRLTLGRSAAIAGIVLSTFYVFQKSKTSSSVSADLAITDASYPELVQPLLPVLRRVDLFAAVTDATSLSSDQWINWVTAAQRAAGALLSPVAPQSWHVPSAGVRWNQEVHFATLPIGDNTTSLAEGFIAEGWLFAGVLGLSFTAFFIAVVVRLVVRRLQAPNPVLAALGMAVLANPAILERGVLGTLEIIGQGLQPALVFGAIVWLLGSPSRLCDGYSRDGHAEQVPDHRFG